jgi:cell division protein FtsI (penicillin-binding protein 3)
MMPARPPAHRTAGKRDADRAETLGRTEHRTIAFGHGMAVAPLQAMMRRRCAGQWRHADPADLPEAHRRGSAGDRQARDQARDQRQDALHHAPECREGLGAQGRPGPRVTIVGGKTGTAEKVVNGRYAKKQVLNSFTAVLPMDNPQFQVLVMLDEPKALPETHGFITSGWNAVPTGGNVIARIAPLLGLEPRFDLAPSDRLILATSKVTQ